jgi:hypothetical protein
MTHRSFPPTKEQSPTTSPNVAVDEDARRR